MFNKYFVYILASKRNGTLYIGVTNNLERRVYEHKNNIVKGFTSKYRVHQLVYYEETNDIYAALQREKQLKKWNLNWKLALIEKVNPAWNDPRLRSGTGFPLKACGNDIMQHSRNQKVPPFPPFARGDTGGV